MALTSLRRNCVYWVIQFSIQIVVNFVFLFTMATAIIVNVFCRLICCCNFCLCKMRPEEVAKITLHDDSRSVRYIANALNLAKCTVHDALR